jgi:hypothetical protein
MITAGSVHAFYLFDVAQGIDLGRVQALVGGQALPAIVPDKSPGTSRVRYLQPPVVAPGESLGAPSLDGFAVRVKFYDYGVISLRLSRPFTGTWGELAGVAQDLIENDALENHATALCQRIAEDYLALVVNRLDAPASAELVLERHGADIAQMLRGERQTLSNQEREEVLRHRLSYLTDDLVVPAYNAAFLYDTEAGAQPSLEILEYVNSQLLEYRYHDELLETELGRIYGALQQPRSFGWLFGRRSARAVKELHSLFIDINELNDRMENVLKLVGDVYAARLFGLAGARLVLDAWKHNVEEKLETLDDIYRFTVEQGSMSRANLLELIIVLILTVEFGFFLRDLLR